MPTALITGISGQDGLYLAEFLAAKGYEVHGLVRAPNNPQLELLSGLPGLTLHVGDLRDMMGMLELVRATAPSEVYNLGAVSSVARSWQHPHETGAVNGMGTLNLLEAVRRHQEEASARVRFFQASSSEMFGEAVESPQSEQTAMRPQSPYGVSKVFGHKMTASYRDAYGVHASSGILFNHESPRRGDAFVTRKVSRGVARISLGLQDELSLGNLDVWRDWGYAGDYVEAMWLMLQQEQPDDYVIATGQSHSLREFVEAAFRYVGLSCEEHVRRDPALTRPADVTVGLADPSKAAAELGWKSKVSFEELVWMMVDAEVARERL